MISAERIKEERTQSFFFTILLLALGPTRGPLADPTTPQ